jgi:hypothetical protein
MDRDNCLEAAFLVGDEVNLLMRVKVGQAPGRRHLSLSFRYE